MALCVTLIMTIDDIVLTDCFFNSADAFFPNFVTIEHVHLVQKLAISKNQEF